MKDPFREDIASLSESVSASLPGRTFLVTGATGLVGSYIVETLIAMKAAGRDIESIHAVSASGRVPRWLTDGSSVARIFGDVSSPSFVDQLPQADVIIHAAGYGQPGKFLSDPLRTFALNTTGTQGLLSKVSDGGTFLFLSSSEVYSGLPPGRHLESQIGTTNTDHPRACYIEGKRGGEAIVNAANGIRDISTKSARLALAYGPGTQKGDARVLNEFISRALKTGELKLNDSGHARRTYGYVKDAVELLFSMICFDSHGTYNVGGESRTSIRDLAALVATLSGAKLLVPDTSSEHAPGSPSDVELSLSKVLELGPGPNWVSLEEGVRRTIVWQQHFQSTLED